MNEEILNDGAPAPSVEPTLRETIGAAIDKQREGAPAPAPAAPDGEGKAPAAPAHESDEAKAARLRDADGVSPRRRKG